MTPSATASAHSDAELASYVRPPNNVSIVYKHRRIEWVLESYISTYFLSLIIDWARPAVACARLPVGLTHFLGCLPSLVPC